MLSHCLYFRPKLLDGSCDVNDIEGNSGIDGSFCFTEEGVAVPEPPPPADAVAGSIGMIEEEEPRQSCAIMAPLMTCLAQVLFLCTAVAPRMVGLLRCCRLSTN